MKKLFKKTVCAALACVSMVGGAFAMTGCTTKNPEVEMKISFNDKTYTLQYKLYRKIAPATTTHFLNLVEGKYYDGLCVHNYSSTRMYTGGYTYDAALDTEGGLVEKDYFEAVKGLKTVATVWNDEGKTSPTYTVRGEFYNNGFDVSSGAIKESYGSLTMYYTPKTDCVAEVYVERASDKKTDPKLYRYNSATSLFYISMSNSTTTNNNYCTFATLKADSKDDLKKLETAIKDYIAEEYAEVASDFAPATPIKVDQNDPYAKAKTETYSVPKQEIRIQSIRVTKY